VSLGDQKTLRGTDPIDEDIFAEENCLRASDRYHRHYSCRFFEMGQLCGGLVRPAPE
jgi:hypothetical protein